MSNPADKPASREEEIAFLIMDQVLGVDIRLADAGPADRKPDGSWTYPGDRGLRGIVEITSPPDSALMEKWARAKKEGGDQSESGAIPLRLNELAQVCTEMLSENWALENISKLVDEPADERHLFLFGRSHRVQSYFYRLSESFDESTAELLEDIMLPQGITDVWFRGRAWRDETADAIELFVTRFQAESGWHRYTARIAEQHLPTPNPSIVDDPVPADWRRPKNRNM